MEYTGSLTNVSRFRSRSLGGADSPTYGWAMAGHMAYVISQPFPASLSPGFQAICPTCGVLDHDSRREDAQGVADGHILHYVKTPARRDRSNIKDYITISEEPVTPQEIDDLRRRQREIEEALSA